VGEGGGIERWFGANVDGACPVLARPVNEVGGGVDRAGSADNKHEGGAVDFALDAVHLEGNLAEEDDVGAEARSADAVGDFVERAVDGMVLDGRATTFLRAARFGEFSVHVKEADRACTLVKVVDVLRTEEEAVAKVSFEFREGAVGGVGLSGLCRGSAGGVKLPDEGGIAVESFGSADVLDAMAGPEAVGGAEGGQAAFGGDAGAGQDKDAVGGGDGNGGHGSTVEAERRPAQTSSELLAANPINGSRNSPRKPPPAETDRIQAVPPPVRKLRR